MTDHYDPDDDLYSYEDFEDIDELAWDPTPWSRSTWPSSMAPTSSTRPACHRSAAGTYRDLTRKSHPPGRRALPDPRLVEDETSDEED